MKDEGRVITPTVGKDASQLPEPVTPERKARQSMKIDAASIARKPQLTTAFAPSLGGFFPIVDRGSGLPIESLSARIPRSRI